MSSLSKVLKLNEPYKVGCKYKALDSFHCPFCNTTEIKGDKYACGFSGSLSNGIEGISGVVRTVCSVYEEWVKTNEKYNKLMTTNEEPETKCLFCNGKHTESKNGIDLYECGLECKQVEKNLLIKKACQGYKDYSKAIDKVGNIQKIKNEDYISRFACGIGCPYCGDTVFEDEEFTCGFKRDEKEEKNGYFKIISPCSKFNHWIDIRNALKFKELTCLDMEKYPEIDKLFETIQQIENKTFQWNGDKELLDTLAAVATKAHNEEKYYNRLASEIGPLRRDNRKFFDINKELLDTLAAVATQAHEDDKSDMKAYAKSYTEEVKSLKYEVARLRSDKERLLKLISHYQSRPTQNAQATNTNKEAKQEFHSLEKRLRMVATPEKREAVLKPYANYENLEDLEKEVRSLEKKKTVKTYFVLFGIVMFLGDLLRRPVQKAASLFDYYSFTENWSKFLGWWGVDLGTPPDNHVTSAIWRDLGTLSMIAFIAICIITFGILLDKLFKWTVNK